MHSFENPKALAVYCESHSEELAKHAAGGLNLPRLLRGLASVASKNPALLGCTTASLLNAVRHCVQLGLEPASPLGLVYIIPYKSEATVVVGYKGLIELALRSGKVESIDAQNVYLGDEIDVVLGTTASITHRPTGTTRNDASIESTYAYAFLPGARAPVIEHMDRAELLAIESRSKARSGPWKTDRGEMMRKTAIRRICKRLPKSGDLDHAINLNNQAEGIDFSNPHDRPRSGRALGLTDRIKGGVAEVVAEVMPDAPPLGVLALEALSEWSGLVGDDLDALAREVREKSGCGEGGDALRIAVDRLVGLGNFPEAIKTLEAKK